MSQPTFEIDRDLYPFDSHYMTMQNGAQHAGITCNQCGSGMHEVRFKCLQCPDFDLCGVCERSIQAQPHAQA